MSVVIIAHSATPHANIIVSTIITVAEVDLESPNNKSTTNMIPVFTAAPSIKTISKKIVMKTNIGGSFRELWIVKNEYPRDCVIIVIYYKA